MGPIVEHRRFISNWGIILALICVAASGRIAKAATKTAVDDDGKEFSLPKDWPEGHPLPNLKPNCVRCHVDKGGALTAAVYNFAQSTHDHEQLSCVSCHGGDVKSDEKAHEGDFISGAKSKLMEKCADCHKPETQAFNASRHFLPEIKYDHPICSTCHDNHSVGKGDFRLANACTSCHGAKAAATTGKGESQILWKARTEGAHGNRISVALVGGANQKLSVEYKKTEAATDIAVHLATDAQGKPTSTAEGVIEAIKLNKELYYIISAEEGGDSLGEGVVEPFAKFNLAGGTDFEAKYPGYGELVRANDALWDSLTILRKDREKMPPKLDDAIAETSKATMRLIHTVPKQPDAAEVKSVIAKTNQLKKDVDAFMAQSK